MIYFRLAISWELKWQKFQTSLTAVEISGNGPKTMFEHFKHKSRQHTNECSTAKKDMRYGVEKNTGKSYLQHNEKSYERNNWEKIVSIV